MRAAACGVLLMVMCAATSAAQSHDTGYVQGLAGTSTAADTDAVFGGGAAVRARARIDVFGEFGRLENGIWTELRDELSAAGADIRRQVEAQFGAAVPVAFEARVPVWYGLGGARVRGPRLGALGTFVEAGIGMARLRPRVELEIDGERLDAEAGRLLTLEEARAEMLTAVGAGVSLVVARRIRVEGGYRYSRVHGDLPININRVHAGLGYAF